MKKKILVVLAASMAITSISLASPLSNYYKGNMAIDLNMWLSPDIKVSDNDFNADAKNRLGFGMSYGVGDNLALQYKYSDNKSKDYRYWDNSGYANAQLIGQEINVLYQVDPSISVFAGLTRATVKGNGYSSSGRYTEKNTKNGFQVGVLGQTKFADNFTGWASVSAGNKITGYELGVGYDVAKNTEVNLFYRHTKYKDFNFDGDKLDVTTKGLGAGITLKF